MATLAFGPIVSTTMAIRATGKSAAGVARRWVTERDSGRRLGHPAAVGALTALVAVAYCGFALAQYYTFRTSSFDLVIFDQAVRSYAHFHPGIAPIFNVFEGLGPNFSILGNHFSPIDARTPGLARGAWPLALVLVPRFAFGPALHPGFYQRNAKMKAAAAADAVVPGGVTVSAVNYLGPQLSARDTVLWWMAGGGTAAPWVVADIETPQFTWSFSTVRATSCCTAVDQAAASVPRRPRDERRLPH